MWLLKPLKLITKCLSVWSIYIKFLIVYTLCIIPKQHSQSQIMSECDSLQ